MKTSHWLLRLTAACVLAALVCASWAQGTAVAVDIPEGDLVGSLEALARQTGTELVFRSDQLRGLRAKGIRGTLTPEAALQELLRGHELQLKRDASGAYVIFRSPPKSESGAPAQLPPGDVSAPRLPPLEVLPKIMVTGSRIPRDVEELGANPVVVFTRRDIDRSGSTTTGEFVSRIAQSGSTVNDVQLSDAPGSGRSVVNLRSLGNNTTLVLLNGRRMSRSGRGFGIDDYDLNMVPLAAIESIEVMTTAASAIYGADAIGGVVNIITRQEYSGAEMTVQHGNTFRNDAQETTVNLLAGAQRKLANGMPFGWTLSASVRDQSALAASDRPYTASNDYSSSGGRTPSSVEQGALAGGPGVVWALGGPFAQLPGLGVRRVAIPSGQNGQGLLISDFDVNAPLLRASDDLPRYTYLLPPLKQAALSASGTLGLPSNDELYFEGSIFRRESHSIGLPPATLGPVIVPASNPFNPFGVDVAMNKVFYELGPSRTDVATNAGRLSTGLRGTLKGLGDWRYDASVTYDRNATVARRPVPTNLNCAPSSIGAPGTPDYELIEPPCYKLLNETDPSKALNMFGDSALASAEHIARLRSVFGKDETKEVDQLLTTAFTTNGTLGSLPAGPARFATGAEFRLEEVTLEQTAENGRMWVGFTPQARHAIGTKRQKAAAVFAETVLPIVGQKQGVPWMHSLEFSLAGRFDKANLVADGEEMTPRAGLMWRPTQQLGIRTNYSRGFKTPNLMQMFATQLVSEQFFADLIDPVTGEPLNAVSVREGGQPDLKSERSESWAAGLLYEPTWLSGFSLSLDYFDTKYFDKVVGPRVSADVILRHFPERVTRDPVTNRVTELDVRPINLNLTRSKSIDLRAIYRFGLGEYGSMTSRSNITYNISSEEKGPPGAPVFEYVGVQVPRVKADTSLFWSRAGYELGGTLSYESSVRNEQVEFGGATAPDRVRRAVVFDLLGSVDIDAAFPGTSLSMASGLKVTAGIMNLFDREPSPTNGDGGWAKVDPRQRRFYIAVRKAFQ